MLKVHKLKDISIQIGSGITPSRTNCKYWENGTIPWLKTEQLDEYEIYETSEHITEQALKETSIKIFPVNTLSIAMYGEGKTRGNVAILKIPMTTNQACCNVVINEEKANYKYVYYFLKTRYNQLRSLSSGVRKNLNSNDIKEFELRIPINVSDQQRIASVLSALDAKIQLNNRINAGLEAMAKTLYDYWFVQFDFPDANGKPYKTSGGKMVWNEQLKREIPEGWETGILNDLGEVIGGSTPPREIEEYFTKDGMAWITPKDLSLNTGNKFITKGEWDITDAGIKAASLNVMPKDTILFSSRAPIGYLAISQEEVTTNQGFKSFVPNKGFPTEYIYYTIKNLIPIIDNHAVGSTFKEISGGTLKTIKTCLPEKKVIEKFTQIVKPIFEKQNLLELENQHLSSLRDWLLPMLMNGQVTVGEAGKEIGNNEKPIINLPEQHEQRFKLWLINQGIAARGDIDTKTLQDIFDAMDDEDK